MKIQDSCSIFSFRPPGVLKSSVSTSPRPRQPLIRAFEEQNLHPLALGIDPQNPESLDNLEQIPESILFFSVLDNAYIIVKEGMDGVIVTEDLHFIKESLYDSDPEKINQLETSSFEDVPVLEDVFLPFNPTWMRYDHWMGYCLSKAYIANLNIPSTTQIVIPQYREQSPSLEYPSISASLYDQTLAETELASRITKLKEGIYKVKKLSLFQPNSYLPQFYFNFSDAKHVFQMLNKKVKYHNGLPAQFMISQDSTMEPVLSSGYNLVLLEICKEMNIPIIQLKNLDWLDQVALFSQAEFIITPHRPELINLFFCQNETKILELTRSYGEKNYIPAWPFMIASNNKINYSFLDVGQDEPDEHLINNTIRKIRAY